MERKRQTGGALDWLFDHAYLVVPAQDAVGQFLATFRDYPQGQKGGQFLDEVIRNLTEGSVK